MDLEHEFRRDARLAAALAALGNPARLALLRQVRTPRALREIRVRSFGGTRARLSAERGLARQTVKRHLDRLLSVGVVVPLRARRPYGETVAYLLDAGALFAITGALRDAARSGAVAAALPGRKEARRARPGPLRPSLVLVGGLDVERDFDLTPSGGGDGEWFIGRRRGSAVCLDTDPFVVPLHARVTTRGRIHFVEDAREGRGQTFVNFEPLPRGVRRPLAAGDLVGVGRSLLMFHPAWPPAPPPSAEPRR